MTEQRTSEKPKYRWLTLLAGGFLICLFAWLGILVALTVGGYRQQFFTVSDSSVTPTSTAVPTPQILVHLPADKSWIRFEDFSSNSRDWSLYYPNGKLELINGKLILQSSSTGYLVVGRPQLFIPVGDTYYVQADFMTDVDADQPYGLTFGMSDSTDTFYLFEILPRDKTFSLYKYASGNWNLVVPFSIGEMKPYPGTNTLSVFFDKGKIELYINGNLVMSYTDQQPYHYVGVGVLASDLSYRLIVDNFFAYSEK